jgi:hypothetical protein
VKLSIRIFHITPLTSYEVLENRYSGKHTSLGDVMENFLVLSTLFLDLVRIRQKKCQENVSSGREFCENWSKGSDNLPY